MQFTKQNVSIRNAEMARQISLRWKSASVNFHSSANVSHKFVHVMH